MTPGILPNGLFWTTQINPNAFTYAADGSWARLRLRNQPLCDTLEFGGPLAIAGQADIEVEWNAVEAPQPRGGGLDPLAPDAFNGLFAESTAVGRVTGFRTGFGFESGQLDAEGFFAELGHQGNGIFQ